jgi:hypothetical protein
LRYHPPAPSRSLVPLSACAERKLDGLLRSRVFAFSMFLFLGIMALWALYVHFPPPGCRSTACAQSRLHQRVAMGTEVKKAVV